MKMEARSPSAVRAFAGRHNEPRPSRSAPTARPPGETTARGPARCGRPGLQRASLRLPAGPPFSLGGGTRRAFHPRLAAPQSSDAAALNCNSAELNCSVLSAELNCSVLRAD